MSTDLTLKQTAPSASRRSVMAIGVKLAYATPVVAATMKMSVAGVLAASPGPEGRHISIPALNASGVDIDVSGATETCISASGDALLCLGDTARELCPVTPPGTNAVCPGGSACCGAHLCGELLGQLDGGPIVEIGAGPTCLDTRAATSLRLFIFDSYYPDNSGSYTAIVTP